jgi:lipopolysaccharide heptosyltransferase II
MKILIIRLSSLGDIILTFPLISLIKSRYPESKIDYLVKKEYTELLQIAVNLDSIIAFDTKNGFSELLKTRKIIKSNNYDVIIDLHNNQRSIFMRSFQRAKKYVFKKHSIKKILFVKFKLNFLKNYEPIKERYISSAEAFLNETGKEEKVGCMFKIPAGVSEELKNNYEFLNRKGIKIVGFCPSARHFTKIYPSEKFIEIGKNIISNFNSEILLFGDKNDIARNETIKTALGNKCHNLAGKLSLIQTAAAMATCELIISNDTGLMHLSNLLKKNLIAIFGSTVREFGFFPDGENTSIFEVDDLKCRPCSHIGRKSCPKKHFKCMNDIHPERIISKAGEVLSSGSGTNT